MNNFWKLSEPKSDKLILIKDRAIFKGNPSSDKISRISKELVGFKEIEKELFSIPFSYIKKIVNQEGVSHIKIFFGKDSEEEIKVDNEKIKNEIFDALKAENKDFHYAEELPSVLNYGKTQIFALLILTAIFIWAMHYAIEISNGAIYEYSGNGSPGIAGLVLALAGIGIMKLIISYIVIGAIAIFSLFKRLRSRTNCQILKR